MATNLAFQKMALEFNALQRVIHYFTKERYVHIELEPGTAKLIQARVSELEPGKRNILAAFGSLAHCLNLYSLEVSILLKLDLALEALMASQMQRIFHAMHDSGTFTEDLVDELFSKIFGHYSKETLLKQLGSQESAEEKLQHICQGLNEHRTKQVKTSFVKHLETLNLTDQ